MTKYVLLLIFAGITSGFSVAQVNCGERSPDQLPDDLNTVLYDRATQAGVSAGIAEACGSYSAPVAAAFKSMLDTVHLDATEQTALWQRYGAMESSTASFFARQSPTLCPDATSIILCTIHDLSRPISLGPSSDTIVTADVRVEEPGYLIKWPKIPARSAGVRMRVPNSFLALS